MFALVLIVTRASGQVLTGTIIGTVMDESQSSLPGVTATLTSPALPGGPVTAVTSETGEYRFVALAPGIYTLAVSLPGFATYQEEGLRVTAAGTLERNITLKVSTINETVTVSGESPMVDVRQVAVSHTVSTELVENLQNQRYSVQEYAKWVPGVSAGDPSARSQSVAVMGSTTSENSWLMDGIVTNSPLNGGSHQGGDPDTIEELQVSTLGASAEYAIAQGAVFNFILKSGTNRFSGTGSYVYQNDSMVSKPTLVDCNCPAGRTGFSRRGVKDYSFHVGGPIIKDRLWYFVGGINWQRKESSPGADPHNQAYDQDSKESGKITWKISNRWKYSGVLNNEPFRTPGRPSLTQPTVSTLLDRDGTGIGIVTYGNELTDELSSSTLLTMRVSGTFDPDPKGIAKSGDYVTPNHTDSATGIQSGGTLMFYRQNLQRHNQSFKINHYIQGNTLDQDIRGGVQTEYSSFSERDAWPGGVHYVDVNGAPDQAIYRNAYGQGSNYNWQGGWAEDQMTFRKRLTLNLGARWDRIKGKSPDLPATDNELKPTGQTIKGLGDLFTWKSISPRLGFNLKLTDDGRTTLRGNYGRAYRPVFLQDLNLISPAQSPSTLKRWDPTTRDYTTLVSITDPLANVGIDPAIKPPFTDQYAIGVDRQIARSMAFSINYVYKHGERQVGWKDTGGIYGTQNVTLANGQTLTVFPLLNAASARRFLLTNGPGYFNKYQGLLLTVTKRMSAHWATDVSYTESRSTGLSTTGTTGQDPNNLINLTGPIAAIDRPHMLTTQSIVEIAPVGVMISANLQVVSGLPYAPQALVQLPQGRQSINIAPPGGVYRFPRQNILALRFSKQFALGSLRKVELIANVNNALQAQAYQTAVTFNYFDPRFAQPSTWMEPRNMNLMAKVSW